MRTGASFALLFVLAQPVLASTWLVEQDGTGQFSMLQDALDAAAPGDSILVGPGSYPEQRPFLIDCCEEVPASIGVAVSDLTIIGESRDSVILGPSDLGETLNTGIATRAAEVTGLRVENLTIQNVFEGTYYYLKQAQLNNLRFVGCVTGVYSLVSSEISIESCAFEDSPYPSSVAIDVRDGTSLSVANCTISGFSIGVSAIDSENISVSGSTITSEGYGINLYGSSARIFTSTISSMSEFGVRVAGGESAEFSGCRISGDQSAMRMQEAGSVISRYSTYFGGSTAALEFRDQRNADFRENNYVVGSGLLVQLSGYHPAFGPEYIDMSLSYWGTTDPSGIEGLIWDGRDDHNLDGWVTYTPLSMSPVTTRVRSVSSLKSLFGGE